MENSKKDTVYPVINRDTPHPFSHVYYPDCFSDEDREEIMEHSEKHDPPTYPVIDQEPDACRNYDGSPGGVIIGWAKDAQAAGRLYDREVAAGNDQALKGNLGTKEVMEVIIHYGEERHDFTYGYLIFPKIEGEDEAE